MSRLRRVVVLVVLEALSVAWALPTVHLGLTDAALFLDRVLTGAVSAALPRGLLLAAVAPEHRDHHDHQ